MSNEQSRIQQLEEEIAKLEKNPPEVVRFRLTAFEKACYATTTVTSAVVAAAVIYRTFIANDTE